MKKFGTLAVLTLVFTMLISSFSAYAVEEYDWEKEAKKWLEGCFDVTSSGGLGDINGEWDAEAFLVPGDSSGGTYGLPNTSDYFQDPIYPDLPDMDEFKWDEFEWPTEGADSDTLGWATNVYFRGNVWKPFGSVILNYDEVVDNTKHHFEICVCIDRYFESGEGTGWFRIAKLYDVTDSLDELSSELTGPNSYDIHLEYFHANDFLGKPKDNLDDGAMNIDTSHEVIGTMEVNFAMFEDLVLPEGGGDDGGDGNGTGNGNGNGNGTGNGKTPTGHPLKPLKPVGGLSSLSRQGKVSGVSAAAVSVGQHAVSEAQAAMHF